MCVRHAYHCKECDTVFEMPLGQSWVQTVLCWLAVGTNDREACPDTLCDNKFCQRRTEGGYRVCLSMQGPCYFCIRFGHDNQCYTAFLSALCRQCLGAKHFKPAHYRQIVPANKEENLSHEAAVKNK